MSERHLHATVRLRGVVCPLDVDAFVLRHGTGRGLELSGSRPSVPQSTASDHVADQRGG